jgi:endoglucanase
MDFLQVKGRQIIDQKGKEVRLRGTCVGGWMNMENFIDGYPGCESGLRRTMNDTIGEENGRYFFDKLLDNFFNEKDVKFIKERGSNVVRLALNYRHFEDDEKPYEYKEDGFARLAKVVDWCEKHGLYVIFDMHAVQGWQNSHWHSDNENSASLFWRHKHFQDRLKALWRELAGRYKGRAIVAGYELMNEPIVNTPAGDLPHMYYNYYKPDWERMNRVYGELVAAIREIDDTHIIFIEGDVYGHLFDGLAAPFAENLVYSSHDYTIAGFGPGKYPGEFTTYRVDRVHTNGYWDRRRQDLLFRESSGARYADKYGVPLWVGEFGSQYNGPAEELPYRLKAMDDQLAGYNDWGAHWTTWTYKDMGVMGWVTIDPESEYARIVAPVQRMKAQLGAENFVGWYANPVGKQMNKQLAQTIAEVIADPFINPSSYASCLSIWTLTGFAASSLQPSYCRCFKGMTKGDIDRVMASFDLENCIVNKPYMEVLTKNMR